MPKSVHRQFAEHQNLNVYTYDPTNEGPEVETIKAILSTHTQSQIDSEGDEAVWAVIDKELSFEDAEAR